MKVNIKEVQSYDFSEIKSYFEKLFTAEKLWEKLKDKSDILLKPNLLGAFEPQKAITTHPIFVEAIVAILLENEKKVLIGDSPGGTVNYDLVLKKTGMKSIGEKYPQVKIVNFNQDGVEEINTKSGKINITKHISEVDAVINLCKYKTHGLTMFTGAVKNLYGTIPGLKKSDYHRKFPNPDEFADTVVSLHKAIQNKICFNFMDGIIGMEGEGPSKGSPRNFGLIFSSYSASALDFVAANLMGFNAEQIPIINKSMKADNLSASQISITEKWQNFKFDNVKIAAVIRSRGILTKLPKFIGNFFRNHFDYYPDFNEKCKKCRVCVDSCPVAAIKLEKQDDIPKIDYEKCIKCLCCHEMCPYDAVFIKKSLIARLIFK